MRRLVAVWALVLPIPAYAEDVVEGAAPPASAAKSGETGAFVPSLTAARGDAHRALTHVEGGWDEARGGGLFASTIEARLAGPVSLRAGALYEGPGDALGPIMALKVDGLRQERHGLDLAIAGGYEAVGFNQVPAVVTRVAVGRKLGGTTLLANVAYAQGLELGERYGDVAAAALTRLSTHLVLGVESRLRADLERDDDEPEGERDWEWLTAPVATFALGRLALTGRAGVSALRLRDGSRGVGPSAAAGIGMVF